jgi:predicted CXXCH cytochrome family protein
MKRIILISVAFVLLALIFAGVSGAVLSGHSQCNFCHYMHGASGVDALLTGDLINVVCLSCHGPGGTSDLEADIHVNRYKSAYEEFSVSCSDCHDAHINLPNWLSSTNIKGVGTNFFNDDTALINTPISGVANVVYTSRGTNAGEPSLHSFADADEDGNGVYDGICEVCHTLTKKHRNNPSGNHSHNRGKTCINCHTHEANFNRH